MQRRPVEVVSGCPSAGVVEFSLTCISGAAPISRLECEIPAGTLLVPVVAPSTGFCRAAFRNCCPQTDYMGKPTIAAIGDKDEAGPRIPGWAVANDERIRQRRLRCPIAGSRGWRVASVRPLPHRSRRRLPTLSAAANPLRPICFAPAIPINDKQEKARRINSPSCTDFCSPRMHCGRLSAHIDSREVVRGCAARVPRGN
jgi:hypothetical protein